MRRGGLDVIAFVFSESGCSWEDEEYSKQLVTVGDGFDIEYIDDFDEAIQEWVSDMGDKLKNDCTYQLFMRHVFEFDGAGATVGRYFEVVDCSFIDWK